jgi:formate dehydrogenase maturation protein FdhE
MVQESYSDITGSSLFKNLNIKGTKRWRKEPPEVCPYCASKETIHGIEILAAYEGALFWECEVCDEKFLRFTRRTTIKHLQKTCELHIDLEGLHNICEQEPN